MSAKWSWTDNRDNKVRRARPPLMLRPTLNSTFREYMMALLIVVLAVSANLLIAPFVGYHAVALILLVTVLISGLFLGRGPMLLAAGSTALALDYLFIPPRFAFNISSIEDRLLV